MPTLAESTEIVQFARETVDRLLGRLAFQISSALKSHDPGSVQGLGIAIRRFTQALAVFRPCFPAKDVRKTRRRLKQFLNLAREVRNCDIALKILFRSRSKEVAALRTTLKSRRRQAEQLLRGALRRWKERKLSLKWRGRLEPLPTASVNTVSELAMEVLPPMAKEFFDRGETAFESASVEDLHKLRVAARNFRYALELFGPLYGAALGVWLGQIRTLEALLNNLKDCATVRNVLSRSDGARKIDSRLRNLQGKHTAALQRQWAVEFAGPARARRWMKYLSGFAERRQVTKKPMARSTSVEQTTGMDGRPDLQEAGEARQTASRHSSRIPSRGPKGEL